MATPPQTLWKKGRPSPNPAGRPAQQVNTPAPPPPTRARIVNQTPARIEHIYDAPITGRIFVAIFEQPITNAFRTVEIVRYEGADAWKARIKETGTVFSRLGQQAEFTSEAAACSDVTEFFKRQGLRLIRQWEAIYPDWRQLAPRGGVQ